MKIKKIDRSIIKGINEEIAEEADVILSKEGARYSMIYAFLYFIASTGIGILISSLLFGVLQHFSLPVNDTIANAVTLILIFIFIAPALAGLFTVTGSVCRGENDLSGLFVAFSSPGAFLSAYLGTLIVCLRYAGFLALLYIPDLLIGFFDNGDGITAAYYPVCFIVTMIAFFVWYFITARLARLPHCLWSCRLPFLKAICESYKGKHVVLTISGKNTLYVFLTLVTMFIMLVFHTGPVWAVQYEITVQRSEEILKKLHSEKSRKDGQDK